MFFKIKEILLHYTWDIAYCDLSDCQFIDGDVVLQNLHYVRNPFKNKWFADPFIIEEDDRWLHLLVEEYDSTVKRGRIAHIVVDKMIDVITECNIVLSLPTHLSFPAIYRHDGEIYVHPESSQSGNSFMYRYDNVADKLVDPMLIIASPLTDAVIHKIGGRYIMSSTAIPDPNGKVLNRYESSSLFGPYRKVDELYFSSSIARMGGQYFESKDGIWYRVAQDCNGAYGKAVLFMDGNEIIARLSPNKWRYAGIHTFNTSERSVVIDLKKYDFPFLYMIKNLLKHEDTILY